MARYRNTIGAFLGRRSMRTIRSFLTGMIFGVLLTVLYVRSTDDDSGNKGAAKLPNPFFPQPHEQNVIRNLAPEEIDESVAAVAHQMEGDILQKSADGGTRYIGVGRDTNMTYSVYKRGGALDSPRIERNDLTKSRAEEPAMNSGGSRVDSNLNDGGAHKQMYFNRNGSQEENTNRSQEQNERANATTSPYIMSPRDTAKKKNKYYTPIRKKDFHQVPLLERPADGRVACPKDLNSTLAGRLECRRRLPNVIGVGVEKCGTAAVSFFLEAHPHLVHSNPQEVFFWNRYHYRGLGWYMNRMPVSSKYQLTMEKTPSYFRFPGIPEEIKRVMPENTKFLVVVRDPFKRAISLYVHLTEKLKIPEHFIDKPVDARRTVRCFLNDTIETSVIRPDGSLMDYNCLVENGIYLTILKKWFQVLPRERFFIVDGDAFVEDPLPVLQELESFLGLPKYFDRTKLYYNEEKGFFCRSGYKPKASCLGAGKGRAHPEVDPAVEKRLRDFFRPHNLEFEQFVGKKFNWT